MRKLAMGFMSGTSMDGIDVAICDMQTQELILGKTFPYSKDLTHKMKAVMQNQAFDMHFFAHLNREIGLAFADAGLQLIRELNAPIQVIGSHGQTLCHQTNADLPYTWQIGCPYSIFEKLKVPVVFDFRTHNVVQGGQGAPLAPLYHQYLFAHERNVAVINIGGISNISLIREGHPLQGYDIGPGNCLLDAWIAKILHQDYDQDGQWALQGQASAVLVNRMKQDHFFHKSFPKSIGKEYFSLAWLANYTTDLNLSAVDVQASLIDLTAQLIAEEVLKYLPAGSPVYLCGGGVKNHALVQAIEKFLPCFQVCSTDAKGISSDFLEAMMIAWLAYCRIHEMKHDVSSIIGGSNQQLLGLICQ